MRERDGTTKISQKGKYALQFMLDLVEHGEDGPVRLRVVAKRREKDEKREEGRSYLWSVVCDDRSAWMWRERAERACTYKCLL